MNLKALILFAGIVFTNLAFSQQFEYESMDWEENPTWMEIDSNLYDEQEVVLINERLIELFYSEEYNNRLLQYYTFRHKVRVFGDDAIQANNKVYISLSGTIDIINAKARVITPDNKIIELDESNILESEGGDGFGPHKYFDTEFSGSSRA